MKKTLILSSVISLSLSAFIMTFSNHNDDLIFEQLEHIQSVKDFEIEQLNQENEALKGQVQGLEEQVANLKAEFDAQPKWISLGEFKVTVYDCCEICVGKKDVCKTATGTIPKENHTIAVDPNVIPLGSKVMIDGIVYTAEDVGGAVQNRTIDVYVQDHSKSFGRKFSEVFIQKGN